MDRIETDAPASVERIPREQIERTPGVNLDDRLRDVPGFSLFRRTSSLAAHPTTQGVSLRGIGPSGASRTLVLWDGVPLNDPFGGWVYWTRVPPYEVDRVEILRGVSTSAFGDRAMGGVVSLFSREPEGLRFNAAYEGGNRNSHELSGGASNLWSRWAASAHARAFTTDGYYVVPEQNRGTVDRPVLARFVAGVARVDWFSAIDRVYLKLDVLAEERENGTPLQRNSTGLGTLAAHWAREWRDDGVSAYAWHSREEFRSTFSAVFANRSGERPTSIQSVPAESTGGAALWTHRGSGYDLLAGADAARTEGYSRDTSTTAGLRVSGGALTQKGAFVQAGVAAGPARFTLGARQQFTGLGHNFFSPSAGVSAGRGFLRARFSGYRGFRAPTLNELHREFRVGNALTQANPLLRPERLWGIETGLDVTGERRRLSVTLFRNSITDLITNVTLSATPNAILRQRQNAAAALARGIEFDASSRWRSVTGELGYLFVDSRFRTGERVPQVPRHQGSARLGYTRGGTWLWAGVRGYASQFEDERNTRNFLLPGFATVQLYGRQSLTSTLAAFAAVENVLDRVYLAGRTPTPLTGAPRLWRIGLRWDR
ncbi:MAG TPA: TonB-dependent receptor [Bryobacteraceae bacterium]|nr:TonB-dependent receptor [Bryobacteraceae bacterium]